MRNNLTRVTREMTFDCAHMLSGYDGACANLHGHTYKVQITIEGTQIATGAKMGMVIDFKDLQAAMDHVIKAPYDHAILFSAPKFRGQSEESLFEWAQHYQMKYYVMCERTTAEYMAKEIRQDIYDTLCSSYKNIAGIYVKLWETPNSFAEVGGAVNEID